jgi:hypothetical protein
MRLPNAAVRVLLLALAVCCYRQAQPADLPANSSQPPHFTSAISPGDIRPHIEYLASKELAGRSGKEARIAAEYVKEQFAAAGLRPLFEAGSYFQEIPGPADEEGKRAILGQNVGGWVPGSDPKLRDEFIIVSAHYDHLGTRQGAVYRGADDNASGVAMMLEVARRVATPQFKPRRSVAFVGFDLEERMLWGSRWFAAHPPWPLEQVKLFITADMIGRSLGDLPLPTVFVMGSEHAPRVRESLDAVGTPPGLEVARLGIDLIGTRSDYGPFRDRNVPFLFFSTGEHPDYHTPNDVPSRVDYAKAAAVSGLVLKVCQHVGNADAAPVWTNAPETDLDEARTLNRIATLLLAADGEKELSGVQRLLVSRAEIQTRQILERGTMTADERTWLVRMAQLMLLSVF